MESVAPPSEIWRITGPVAPARLSPAYRFGAFLVSLGMILLPLIYVAMIVGAGWWLWEFAEAGPPLSTGRRKSSGVFLTYVAPLVIGGIALLFMIKPLFSRRPKSAEPRALRRE